MQFINQEKFLPVGVINTLKSQGCWNVDDSGWEDLIETIEKRAISTIKISVNFAMIEKDVALIEELITLYAQSSLMNPLVNFDGMRENGEIALNQYNELIELIKINQKENGIITDEESTTDVAGIAFFT